MLYHLIKNVHPALQRNKATKPSKPHFNGNINKFLLQYKNWLQYKENRPQPHVYDDDEIADDFLSAVKTDPWAAKLKKGIEFVETKLDRWKNTDSEAFPASLKLEFIGHTLMTPYIENNTNPLEGFYEEPSPARIRAFQQHGRSRSNSRTRMTPQQPRGRSASRSIPPMRECKICGTAHRENTAGCPNLHKQLSIQKWIDNANRGEIQRQLEVVDSSRRERSTSRDSRQSARSYSTDNSRRDE